MLVQVLSDTVTALPPNLADTSSAAASTAATVWSVGVGDRVGECRTDCIDAWSQTRPC
jgi:hypothetical protein